MEEPHDYDPVNRFTNALDTEALTSDDDDAQYSVARFGEYGPGLWGELALVCGAICVVVVLLKWLGYLVPNL
jgi:hypothetical protein